MSVKYESGNEPKLLREYPEFIKLGDSTEFDGEVYLARPSWDCDRYWGFGYLECWDDRKQDIDFHTHINSEFSKLPDGRRCNWFDGMKALLDKGDVFESDKDRWKFLEIVKTIYSLQETAEVLGRGGSHYTTNPCAELIMNHDEVRRINCKVIPALIDEMYKLLEANGALTKNP